MRETSSRIIHVLAFHDRSGDFQHLAASLTRGTQARFDVRLTASRAEALESVHRGENEIALIAGSSGDESATDFLRELRAQRPGLPIILLTNGADTEFEATAEQAGAAECLELATLDQEHLERAILRSLQAATEAPAFRTAGTPSAKAPAAVDSADENLRTQTLLANVLRHVALVTGRLDAEGRVIDVQGAPLLPASLRPEQLIGRVFSDVFAGSRAAIATALAGGDSQFSLSGQSRRQTWHADFSVSFDHSLQAGATFVGRDVTELRWLQTNLLDAVDAERRQLGTDLHDGLGQQLTGLALLLAAQRERLRLALPGEVPQAEELCKLAQEASLHSRTLSRGYSATCLDQNGLPAALAHLAEQTEQLHGVRCNFQSRGGPLELTHASERHLFHLAQEGVRNAIRHGAAQHLVMRLVSRGSTLRFSLSDDGDGFDLEQVRARSTGRGLRLMQLRANAIGGTFLIVSQPGRGTRLTCQFSSPPPS